jgi:hypothetical protein
VLAASCFARCRCTTSIRVTAHGFRDGQFEFMLPRINMIGVLLHLYFVRIADAQWSSTIPPARRAACLLQHGRTAWSIILAAHAAHRGRLLLLFFLVCLRVSTAHLLCSSPYLIVPACCIKWRLRGRGGGVLCPNTCLGTGSVSWPRRGRRSP